MNVKKFIYKTDNTNNIERPAIKKLPFFIVKGRWAIRMTKHINIWTNSHMLRNFSIILTFGSLAWIVLGTILIFEFYNTPAEFLFWVPASILFAGIFTRDLLKIREISQIYLKAFAKIFTHNMVAAVICFSCNTALIIFFWTDPETNIKSNEGILGIMALLYLYIYTLIYLAPALLTGFAFVAIKLALRIRKGNLSKLTEA